MRNLRSIALVSLEFNKPSWSQYIEKPAYIPFKDTPYGDARAAQAYLGVGEDRFSRWRREGIVKEIAKNLFWQPDLDKVGEILAADRSSSPQVKINESSAQKGRKVDRASNRSPDWKAEKLLWK